MSLLETILSAQGGNLVKQMASTNGIDSDAALKLLGKLVPSLTNQVQQNVKGSDQGLDNLMGALQSGHHQRYLDSSDEAFSANGLADGNKILGHLLGSKDNSRALASSLSGETGIATDLIKKMLPQAATMVMGALSKQNGGGGALSGLASMLGGNDRGAAQGLLASFLDRDNDGSIVDDVMAMAAKSFFK